MKIAPLSVALTAAIAVGAVASPSLAQDYYGPRNAVADCQVAKHQDQTAGGLLGALAGAVIGSNIAHGGGRTGGALIGAAAGAAGGSNIGVSNAHSTEACQVADREGGWQPAAYYAPPPPPRVMVAPAYYGPDYGPYGYPHHHYHRVYYRPW